MRLSKFAAVIAGALAACSALGSQVSPAGATPITGGPQVSLGLSSLAGPDAEPGRSGGSLGFGAFGRLGISSRLTLGAEFAFRQHNIDDLSTWSGAATATARGDALVRPSYRIFVGAGASYVYRLSASISDGEDGRTDAIGAITRSDVELRGFAGVSWRGLDRRWDAAVCFEHGLFTIDAGSPSLTARTRTTTLVIGVEL